MVKQLQAGSHNLFDLGEVEQPATNRVYRSFADKFDAKTVAMQARALVTRRNVGQPVRGLKRELARYAHHVAGWFRKVTLACGVYFKFGKFADHVRLPES